MVLGKNGLKRCAFSLAIARTREPKRPRPTKTSEFRAHRVALDPFHAILFADPRQEKLQGGPTADLLVALGKDWNSTDQKSMPHKDPAVLKILRRITLSIF